MYTLGLSVVTERIYILQSCPSQPTHSPQGPFSGSPFPYALAPDGRNAVLVGADVGTGMDGADVVGLGVGLVVVGLGVGGTVVGFGVGGDVGGDVVGAVVGAGVRASVGAGLGGIVVLVISRARSIGIVSRSVMSGFICISDRSCDASGNIPASS